MGASEPPRRRETGTRPDVGPSGKREPAVDLPIARVLPDVNALARPFDYLVPARLDARVGVGSIVRIPLHGRRIRGWVVDRVAHPETDRRLQAVAGVTGCGPSADVIELTEWAAWRWAGPQASLLRTASPIHAVRYVDRMDSSPEPQPSVGTAHSAIALDALEAPVTTVRLPPGDDPFLLVLHAAVRGDALVLAPSVGDAAYLAARLRHAGHRVALLPDDWAMAAAGGCVAVGPRRAAWAPRPRLGAAVVIDEHDEAYQEERTPTWNGRDVVVERARRAQAPCVLVSACPSLEALATTRLLTVSRADERVGWPLMEVIDRRHEPPGTGLYSERLVALARQADTDERVVCVLNRKGRARLLACAACSELARCEKCDAAVESSAKDDADKLVCRRCLTVRPLVCLSCGGGRFRVLRAGVSRAREDLERLVGRPVAEVSADVAPGPPPSAPVLVGTEAVLHRVSHAQVVAFLDFDQELLAPRYRASERAFGLLARAARILGGRSDKRRLVVQTRLPDHEVIDAAVHADPARLTVVESARRSALGFPPERALAIVSGEGAGEFTSALRSIPDIDIAGPAGGQWMVRAADHRRLCDALAATPRPKARTRVTVDPLRS
ncbi:MAG TPA: hypothetical protein VM121_02425 [Acidimicrobiales bacterium]|nr:hypothetical protein [Acidimicrobiales bacterium]